MTPKKPTLTERVTRLEKDVKTLDKYSRDQNDAIDDVERITRYTEINTVQLGEDARKARHDARVAMIFATTALAVSLVIVLANTLDSW